MAEAAPRAAVRREAAVVVGVVLAVVTLAADVMLMPVDQATADPAKELVRLAPQSRP